MGEKEIGIDSSKPSSCTTTTTTATAICQNNEPSDSSTPPDTMNLQPLSSGSIKSDGPEGKTKNPLRQETTTGAPKNLHVRGVKGVILKQFEQTVVKILPHVQPKYYLLPPQQYTAQDHPKERDSKDVVDDDEKTKDWPFHQLPPAARVHGSLPGQLPSQKRAQRKEDQIRSMLRCILHLLNSEQQQQEQREERQGANEKSTIVDFGGGSGHLAIPLALLLPNYRVIIVDLKIASLQFSMIKAEHCICAEDSWAPESITDQPQQQPLPPPPLPPQTIHPTSISNLFVFHGPIDTFLPHKTNFIMGVALHVCGEATDIVLRHCGKHDVPYMVAAPCCVGKLSTQSKNPYIYHATNQNVPTIQYPQSQVFQQLLAVDDNNNNNNNDDVDNSTQTDDVAWNYLAKAADFNHDDGKARNAARRTAKALLETDRMLFLQETYGYSVALTRMQPLSASPKNDILLGWRKKNDSPSVVQLQDCPDSSKDAMWTMEHLLCKPLEENNGGDDSVDWTWQEEKEMRDQLKTFVHDCPEETERILPTGMSKRKRKLVHYVAEQMGLAHWSHGKKYAEKTVGIRKRRPTNHNSDGV